MKIICETVQPTNRCCLTIFFVVIFLKCCLTYERPKSSLKIYRRGFEVSVPDAKGITAFGFHAHLNKKMNSLEVGDIHEIVYKPENGSWITRHPTIKLKLGDTLTYWSFIINNKQVYIEYPSDLVVDHYSIRLIGQNVSSVGRPKLFPPTFRIYREGFEVSIPDEDEEIELFEFHANHNKELNDLEVGEWFYRIDIPRNGSWLCRNNEAKLKLGDTIYYWTFVIKNGTGYVEDNGVYTADHYLSRKPFSSDGQYEIPTPTFQIYRKGFEVAIPDEPGITLFEFHANQDKNINALEAGEWSGEIQEAENGKWIFRNQYAELKLGDTIYYWAFVMRNGLGYVEDQGVFKVEHYSSRRTFPSDGLYEIPSPIFKIHCKGFEVSIPDVEDISLFGFMASLDRQKEHSILLQWNRFINQPVNGRLVISDNSTQLELGDSIAYMIAVRKNDSYYYQDDIYEVNHYVQ